LVKPDGTRFWAHLTGTTAQGEGGAPVCRCVIGDITERKRAEEALRTSQELFSAFMANNPAAAWITDRLGVLTRKNQRKLVVDHNHGWLRQIHPADAR
jgi:PAS domain-containing protein